MSVTETRYEHIVLSDRGVPLIPGTAMKVIELVREQQAYGWSVEELHFQHPYLSLGQIHSALAYYWDHKDDLDADIERRRIALPNRVPLSHLRQSMQKFRLIGSAMTLKMMIC